MIVVKKSARLKSSKSIAFIALGVALICVLSPLALYIGTIPISLSVFAILLIAGIFEPKKAVIAVCVYILIGMIGLPVFAGYKGGVQAIVGATGGYIVGYIPMTFITSFLINKFEKNKFMCVISMIIGVLICYLFGTIWFSVLMDMSFVKSLTLCVIPFLLADGIKIALAFISIISLKSVLKKFLTN